eukprot:scaffold1593_cov193-Alexandrium_tamarense.AAC.96
MNGERASDEKARNQHEHELSLGMLGLKTDKNLSKPTIDITEQRQCKRFPCPSAASPAIGTPRCWLQTARQHSRRFRSEPRHLKGTTNPGYRRVISSWFTAERQAK